MSRATTDADLTRIGAINRIRWQARSVENLVSTIRLLSVADQKSTLKVSARLVDDLARGLAALRAEVAA